MIQSMTGYGKANGISNVYTFEVEIKSVNSRFLDIYVRLPKDLSSKEIELRSLIKKNINRGKVSLNITMSKEGLNTEIPSIDNENLTRVLRDLNLIKNEAGIIDTIKLSDILSFPNIFLDDNSELSESEYAIVNSALLEAINKMKEMRTVEGQILTTDLTTRIQKISEIAEEINEQGRGSIEEHFIKLKERAAELVEGIGDNDDRLKMELALLAEKYDITEEYVRLESHISQFLSTLEKGKEAGKKLNFIVQEMNREVNTMSNKSVSLEITNRTLELKEELEKIREQIQNIE